VRKVGIDAISFYTSRYFLDLKNLAKFRGHDEDKFLTSLGQHKMSVPPPDEDVVTLAANAAEKVLENYDRSDITALLFATETGIDQSKSAGIYVHRLLGLSSRCRVLELKQACYSATAAIKFSLPLLEQDPIQKILVIASDIARYGLNSTGESSQGCGAVAMVLSTDPKVLSIDPESGIHTEDAMDFWRPNYRDEAFVEGKYSSKLYLSALEKTWQHYKETSKREFSDHSHFCYHVPIPRLVETAHKFLAKMNGHHQLTDEDLYQQAGLTLNYSRDTGNCYTASLYEGLVSLLDHSHDLSDARIGFYSYGLLWFKSF